MTIDTKYLTVGLDRQVFAVPVEHVQEILDMCEISKLPYAPSYLVGMIDVRGQGVPVMDLRTKLGMPSAPVTPSTRILVLDVLMGDRRLILGLIADRVIEVTSLDDTTLQPPPEIGVGWRSEYIVGIGRRGADFVVVFDVLKLLTTEEVDFIAPPSPDVAA
jgi:purine-binding chemotaxis protein CheW